MPNPINSAQPPGLQRSAAIRNSDPQKKELSTETLKKFETTLFTPALSRELKSLANELVRAATPKHLSTSHSNAEKTARAATLLNEFLGNEKIDDFLKTKLIDNLTQLKLPEEFTHIIKDFNTCKAMKATSEKLQAAKEHHAMLLLLFFQQGKGFETH